MEKLLEKAIAGGIAGFVAAIAVDFDSFKTFQKVEEFAQFDWAVAGKRWIFGFVSSAVAGAMAGER